MVQLPLPRFVGAAAAALAVGVLVSGGWNLTKPEPRQVAASGSGPTSAPTSPQSTGSNSPSNPEDGGAGDDDAGKTPSPTLTRMPQPKEAFPAPSLPPQPKKSAAELTQIEYKLKTFAWIAAGKVYPKTSVDCTVSEDDLIEVGSEKFACEVKFEDVTAKFDVNAKVTSTNIVWDWKAKSLPVTEKKALYEVQRQAFKPAKVTCDLVSVELVEVDAKDGITCWVTTPDNKQIVYNGQLVVDGSLIFQRIGVPR